MKILASNVRRQPNITDIIALNVENSNNLVNVIYNRILGRDRNNYDNFLRKSGYEIVWMICNGKLFYAFSGQY